jgi:hypothetical protein
MRDCLKARIRPDRIFGNDRPFECHEKRAAALFQPDLFDEALQDRWR